MRCRVGIIAVCVLGIMGVMGQTRPDMPGFEADYQKVLHILKAPPTTGVLVADVTRGGPAEQGGLQAGDIIVAYAGTPVETLHVLQNAVAEAIAVREADPKSSLKVDIKINRPGQGAMTCTVVRGGLAITPVAVVSGVAGRLNPPATPAGELKLSWDGLPEGSQFIVMRDPEGHALGYTQLTLKRDADRMECQTRTVTPESVESFTVRFAGADGKTLPAFLMEGMIVDMPWGKMVVARQGSRLVQQDRVDDRLPEVTQSVMAAVPLGCGVVALAGAMPHEAGKVFAFSGVDPLSMQTQPGWALETLGLAKVKTASGGGNWWGVQSQRLGSVQMTWWFDDQRRLMAIESVQVRGERVENETAARKMVDLDK